MEFVPWVALGALVVKFFDFLRYAKARDLNGVTSQLIVWISGIAAVLWVAQTQWAHSIVIGGIPLDHMSFWSLALAGITLSSTGSLAKDYMKALDNSNSAAIPTLLPAGPTNPPANPPGTG